MKHLDPNNSPKRYSGILHIIWHKSGFNLFLSLLVFYEISPQRRVKGGNKDSNLFSAVSYLFLLPEYLKSPARLRNRLRCETPVNCVLQIMIRSFVSIKKKPFSERFFFILKRFLYLKEQFFQPVMIHLATFRVDTQISIQ